MPGLTLLLSLTALLGIKDPDSTAAHVTRAKNFTGSEKNITYKLGDRNISVRITQYGPATNTCCINLHDDEATAVKAARSILEERGGILIKIENNAQRMISFPFKGVQYIFDPNRIFSLTGIGLTLKARGKINPLAVAEVDRFAKQLLELIPDSIDCLIALHNNTNGDFSVKTYEKGGSRQHDASQVYADNWQDADDIVLTTDEPLFSRMAASGYNSILQDNVKVFKDGSLSVYCGERNRRYVNIETQHGKTVQYKEMLNRLLYILDEEKKPAANDLAEKLH